MLEQASEHEDEEMLWTCSVIPNTPVDQQRVQNRHNHHKRYINNLLRQIIREDTIHLRPSLSQEHSPFNRETQQHRTQPTHEEHHVACEQRTTNILNGSLVLYRVDVVCSLPVDEVDQRCKEKSLGKSAFGEHWVSFDVDDGSFHQDEKDGAEAGIVDVTVIDFVRWYLLYIREHFLRTSLIILLKEVIKPLLTPLIISTTLMRHNIHQIISRISLQPTREPNLLEIVHCCIRSS